MQNDEYYALYMKEWEKMLGCKNQPVVTDAERKELKDLLKSQKDSTEASDVC